MKIRVMNYEQASEFIPTVYAVAIRIFDPGCSKADGNNAGRRLKPSPYWVAQFCYVFDDIDLTVYDNHPEEQEKLRTGYDCFTPEIAKQIVLDVGSSLVRSDVCVKELVIHCNAGISRSVAVAHALIERFGIESEWGDRRTKGLMACAKDKYKDYVGNRWVYNTILEVPWVYNTILEVP